MSDTREEIATAAQFSAELGNMMGFIDSQWTDRPRRESMASKLDPRKVIRNAVSTDPGYAAIPIPTSAEELIPQSSGDAPLPIPSGEFRRVSPQMPEPRMMQMPQHIQQQMRQYVGDQIPYVVPQRNENDPQLEFDSIVTSSNQRPVTNMNELVDFITKKFNVMELELNTMRGFLVEIRKLVTTPAKKQKKVSEDESQSPS